VNEARDVKNTHSRVNKRRSLFLSWSVIVALWGSEVVQRVTTPEVWQAGWQATVQADKGNELENLSRLCHAQAPLRPGRITGVTLGNSNTAFNHVLLCKLSIIRADAWISSFLQSRKEGLASGIPGLGRSLSVID
jgi:hypothetical protein